jgi:hypothetical protein
MAELAPLLERTFARWPLAILLWDCGLPRSLTPTRHVFAACNALEEQLTNSRFGLLGLKTCSFEAFPPIFGDGLIHDRAAIDTFPGIKY